MKKNQDALSLPELGAFIVLLDILQRCIATETKNVKALLTCTQSPAVTQNSSVLLHLARILTALISSFLYNYFKPVLNFYKFDFEPTPKDDQKFELYSVLTKGFKEMKLEIR